MSNQQLWKPRAKIETVPPVLISPGPLKAPSCDNTNNQQDECCFEIEVNTLAGFSFFTKGHYTELGFDSSKAHVEEIKQIFDEGERHIASKCK